MKDRKIHGECNVWSSVQRQKKIYRFNFHVGFEGNHRSAYYGKQCSLVQSCIEERGVNALRRTLDFEVEGKRKKRTWKKQVEEESVKIGLRMKMHFADQSGVLV